MSVQILIGDCREVLRTLPDESVHCCVTSPPYWGLRDYGNGAGGIGLEETIDGHMAALVGVFHEVRRVLRADGTLWVNYGDAYAGSGRGGNPTEETSTLQGGQSSQRASMIKRVRAATEIGGTARDAAVTSIGGRTPPALKPKDLMGLPWRLAFALQADGWWLRQDIIWHKPNPMPESIGDRCTKAHEYIFLLSKSQRYFFDAEAIAEEASLDTHARVRTPGNKTHKGTEAYENGDMFHRTKAGLVAYSDKQARKIKMPDGWDTAPGGHGSFHCDGREKGKTNERPPGVTPKSAPEDSMVRAKESWHALTTEVLETRNKRSVWTVASAPFPDAHFATFPPALIEPCILAGCPEGGTVLDCFGGAGTTGLVADRRGRNAILIELNPEYAAMARRRIEGDAGMFASVNEPTAAPPSPQQEKLAL